MTVLATTRLDLREADIVDAGFLHRLMNEEAFLRFVGDRGVRTPADAESYIRRSYLASYTEHGYGLWIVERRTDGMPAGICGLLQRRGLSDVELGFAFLPEYRGLGYGFESAAAVLDYGHSTIGLDRIVAITDPENAPSIRLLERLGMVFEGMFRPGPDTKELRRYASTGP